MTRVGYAAILAAGVLSSAAPARAEDWTLRLEAGSEYDTNIHRLEVADGDPDPDEAPLLRLGARYSLRNRKGKDGFSLRAYGGTKMFLSGPGQSESAFVVSTIAGYSRLLPQRRMVVGVRGSYYDAIHYEAFDCDLDCGQVAEGRFFSSAAAEGTLGLAGPGSHRVTAVLGYRTFEYKPDIAFDWDGEHYGLSYTTSIWRDGDVASFDIIADYRLSHRRYVGSAFTNVCPDADDPEFDCFVPTELSRVDLNHAAAAEAIYTGNRIYSARYEVAVNDSNSFGQSLIRQRLELELTSELFAGLFLTATGVVQLNVFLDPLLLARDVNSQTIVSIEDENRNSLSVHLSRKLRDKWAVEGRYSIFSNEFATQEFRFRRQTLYLGLLYDFGKAETGGGG